MAETIKKVVEIEVDVDSGDINQLNTKLKKTTKTIKETKKESGGFGEKLLKVGDAIKGLGIGLAIAGLAKLGDAFRKNQKIADATENTMNSLDVAFSRFTNTIAESETVQSSTWRDWLSTLATIDPTQTLNLVNVWVNGTKAGREYTEELEKIGKQITANNKELVLLEVEQRRLQILNQQEAELQRQIRDDSTLTFEERFAANDQLATQLDESIKKEKEVVNLRIANLEFLQNNLTYSFEREVEILNLRNEFLDIEERITGVKSEQQAAERSLYAEQKALREQANKDAEDALKESEEAFQEWWDNLNEIEAAEAEKNYQKRMERLHRELDAIQAQNEAQEDEKKEYFKEIEDLDEANFQKTLSFQELELRSVRDQYFRLIELAEIYGADKTKLEEDLAIQEANIKKKYEDEALKKRKENTEEATNATIAVTKAGIDSAISLNDFLVDNQLVTAKKGFQIAKALSIANATISTAEASIAAYKSVVGIPYVGPVLAPIAAGIAVAAGVAQISSIANQQFNTSGGGAPSVGGGGASTPSAGGGGAPQFNTVGTSGFNQVAGSIANQNQEPVKAYVVSTDITSQQSLDRNSRNKASFP